MTSNPQRFDVCCLTGAWSPRPGYADSPFFHCDVFFVLFVFAAFYCNHIATVRARVPHTIRVLATHYVVGSPGFTVTFFVLLCGLLSASMLWLPCHRYGKSTVRHLCGLHIGDNWTFLCTTKTTTWASIPKLVVFCQVFPPIMLWPDLPLVQMSA